MKMKLRRTLSYRLFRRVAPVIAVTLLAIGILAFRSATFQINHVYDARLISDAHNLWSVIEDELGDEDKYRKTRRIDLTKDKQAAFNRVAASYADSQMFRVWRDGVLILGSDHALPASVPMQQPGFSTVDDNGAHWRIYSLELEDEGMIIEMGEKMTLRKALVRHILVDLFVPLLLLVPLVALSLWWGITGGLSTIRALIDQIGRRNPDDLTAIHLKLPSDLQPLQQSINQLLANLQHSLSAEKRFADNAAHQLRTPLATIKLQLQLLQGAASPAEQKQLLTDLIASTERASRLVGQLLTAARINHQPLSLQQVSLMPLLAQILAEFGPLVKEKRLELALEGDQAELRADETLLRLLLNNLIDNAVKYTPGGGQILVQVASSGEGARITITDNGPGIAPEARGLVFERFYRVTGAAAEGTGLGLAIVGEIVSRLNGQIALADNPAGRGLQVQVTLP